VRVIGTAAGRCVREGAAGCELRILAGVQLGSTCATIEHDQGHTMHAYASRDTHVSPPSGQLMRAARIVNWLLPCMQYCCPILQLTL
jgi:hypothetical protein